MKGSENRIGRFGPLRFNLNVSTTAGGYDAFDIINSGASYINTVGFDTTSEKTHEPVRAIYALGEASTTRHYFSCEIPAGAHRIEKVVARCYAAVPTTDAQFRVGLYTPDANSVLYTSAAQSLAVNYSATAAALQYEWAPGVAPAAFEITPYDLKLDTGDYPVLVGCIQAMNPVGSTLYMHAPVVYFKTGAQYRQ